MKGHARQLMTAPVATASPETSLAEAARELADIAISGLPVVESSGQVVGIIAESDLLNALLQSVPAGKIGYHVSGVACGRRSTGEAP